MVCAALRAHARSTRTPGSASNRLSGGELVGLGDGDGLDEVGAGVVAGGAEVVTGAGDEDVSCAGPEELQPASSPVASVAMSVHRSGVVGPQTIAMRTAAPP